MKGYLRSFRKLYSKQNMFAIITDILFLLAILGYSKLMNSVFPQDPLQLKLVLSTLTSVVFVVALYYLGIVLIYSAFKFATLKILFGKKLEKNKFMKFFGLNLIVFIVFTVFAGIISFILKNVKADYQNSITLSILIPFIFLFYIFLNYSHIHFIEKNHLSSSLIKGAKSIFSRSWMSLLLCNVIIVAIFTGLSILVAEFFLGSQIIVNILYLVVFYVLFLNNRLFLVDKSQNLNKKGSL